MLVYQRVSIKWGIDDIEVIEALGISGRGQSCQPNMDYDERWPILWVGHSYPLRGWIIRHWIYWYTDILIYCIAIWWRMMSSQWIFGVYTLSLYISSIFEQTNLGWMNASSLRQNHSSSTFLSDSFGCLLHGCIPFFQDFHPPSP